MFDEGAANEIECVKCVYKGDLDVDQLVVELQMFKAICHNENFEDCWCFEDVRQNMQNHPKMLPARFNSLALLKFHKERTDNMKLLNVVNEFVSKETRLSLFGCFTEKDF